MVGTTMLLRGRVGEVREMVGITFALYVQPTADRMGDSFLYPSRSRGYRFGDQRARLVNVGGDVIFFLRQSWLGFKVVHGAARFCRTSECV